MNEQEKYDWMVYVSCMTYNHAPYIVDAMNGFTMQETNFPFVCAVVDDASTDGEQEVIKSYLNEHFDLEDKNVARHEETNDYVLTFARHKTNKNCYFAVLYLKYNHYSIKKSKIPYIAQWRENAKYIALCEGDDYWIAPDKLQKQVVYLENHPDYTMACNRTQLYSVKQNKMIGENYCYDKSCDMIPKDVIYRTGLFISTCSIVYRKEVTDNRSEYWVQCKVGDYPLQIGCAMKGKVFYFNDIMSVYRIENSNSWMGQQKWGKMDKRRLEIIKSRVDMLDGFSKDYPLCEDFFKRKIANEINRNISDSFSKQEIKQYRAFFSKEIENYSFFQKLDLLIRQLGIPKITGLYIRLFQSQYNQRKLVYKE